jgi:hypothetical protein
MKCDDARADFLAGEPTTEQTAHLASCRECVSIASDLRTTRSVLGEHAFWEEPPPELEQRVVTLIAGTLPSRRAIRSPARWVAAAAVAAALVITGGLWVIQSAPSADWEAALQGTTEAPEAAAVVRGWAEDSGTRLALDISGLAEAPPGTVYEVWFSRKAIHISAGTFTAGGEIEMWTGISRQEFPRIWITLEPVDPNESPSGLTVLDTG